MTAPPAPGRQRHQVWWLAAFAALAVAIVVRNVTALSTVPPGLYIDEASIGYNAWSIAHYGVDEHGVRLPLYFQAFGEYKNPVYIYALVPLLRFLPLTSAVERFPAALFGLLTVFFITWSAWRITRSLPLTLCSAVLAAVTPWLIQESRVGFEVISMVALLAGALWCLADDQHTSKPRYAISGVLFALAIFAYTTARLEILLFLLAFLLASGTGRRRRAGWWLLPVPVVAGFGVLGVWALVNGLGRLTAHFSAISIASDGAGLPTLVARFVSNYFTYFGPDFLFISGDHNPRHNTGFAGMLLAITLPLLLSGLWVCWRRRAEAFPRFLLLCLALSPVSAALTQESVPHALRAATMLPLLLLLATYGLLGVRDMLSQAHVTWRRLVVFAGVVALLVQAGLYALDMYTAYPARSALAFDAGVEPAIATAAAQARGHMVYIASDLDEPYIQAFFALLPAPPRGSGGDDVNATLQPLGVLVTDPVIAAASAVSGDVLVLLAADPPPPIPVDVIATEDLPQNPFAKPAPRTVIVYVDRVR